MPQCQTCAHSERQKIDRLLISGESHRSVAKQFSLSESSVYRHAQNHLPARLVKAEQAQEVADADVLLEQARGLYSKSVSLLKRAEADGDIKVALSGIAQARGCLELLGKLAGELESNRTVNIIVMPEWRHIRGVLLQALQPHPEARVAVADALLMLGDGDGDD